MASRQLVALNKTNGYGDGFFLYDGSLYYGYGEGNGASFEAKQAG